MTYCSVVTVLALVGLKKKCFGHYAILNIFSLRSPRRCLLSITQKYFEIWTLKHTYTKIIISKFQVYNSCGVSSVTTFMIIVAEKSFSDDEIQLPITE